MNHPCCPTCSCEKRKEPPIGATYWSVETCYPESIRSYTWFNDLIDQRNFSHHNVFKTREEAERARDKVLETLKGMSEKS